METASTWVKTCSQDAEGTGVGPRRCLRNLRRRARPCCRRDAQVRDAPVVPGVARDEVQTVVQGGGRDLEVGVGEGLTPRPRSHVEGLHGLRARDGEPLAQAGHQRRVTKPGRVVRGTCSPARAGRPAGGARVRTTKHTIGASNGSRRTTSRGFRIGCFQATFLGGYVGGASRKSDVTQMRGTVWVTAAWILGLCPGMLTGWRSNSNDLDSWSNTGIPLPSPIRLQVVAFELPVAGS